MFFIFSPPFTKNAKSDLPLFMKIKESWSFIKLRLKERISGNEMIEMGEDDRINFVRDKLYPLKGNYIAERSKRVEKHDEKNQTDLKTPVKSGQHSVNISKKNRTGEKHKFKDQNIDNDNVQFKGPSEITNSSPRVVLKWGIARATG